MAWKQKIANQQRGKITSYQILRLHNCALTYIEAVKFFVPARRAWILELPRIQATLEALNTPVMDRACLQNLFGVGRRRAIQLMYKFGGYQTGRTFSRKRKIECCTRSAGWLVEITRGNWPGGSDSSRNWNEPKSSCRH
jgi:hypothetical protein